MCPLHQKGTKWQLFYLKVISLPFYDTNAVVQRPGPVIRRFEVHAISMLTAKHKKNVTCQTKTVLLDFWSKRNGSWNIFSYQKIALNCDTKSVLSFEVHVYLYTWRGLSEFLLNARWSQPRFIWDLNYSWKWTCGLFGSSQCQRFGGFRTVGWTWVYEGVEHTGRYWANGHLTLSSHCPVSAMADIF